MVRRQRRFRRGFSHLCVILRGRHYDQAINAIHSSDDDFWTRSSVKRGQHVRPAHLPFDRAKWGQYETAAGVKPGGRFWQNAGSRASMDMKPFTRHPLSADVAARLTRGVAYLTEGIWRSTPHGITDQNTVEGSPLPNSPWRPPCRPRPSSPHRRSSVAQPGARKGIWGRVIASSATGSLCDASVSRR
jgi:hypothetical protein